MFSLLISDAYGQATTQAGGFASFAPMIIIFAIFYFLIIRPQKKKLDDEKTMIAALGKGDEVFTKSGLLGTIVGMTEKIVTLEVTEGVKLKILKSQVGGSSKSIFETKKEATKVVEKK